MRNSGLKIALIQILTACVIIFGLSRCLNNKKNCLYFSQIFATGNVYLKTCYNSHGVYTLYEVTPVGKYTSKVYESYDEFEIKKIANDTIYLIKYLTESKSDFIKEWKKGEKYFLDITEVKISGAMRNGSRYVDSLKIYADNFVIFSKKQKQIVSRNTIQFSGDSFYTAVLSKDSVLQYDFFVIQKKDIPEIYLYEIDQNN